MSEIAEKIKELIKKDTGAEIVEVVDQSAQHAGHAGAKESGGGHYSVLVISDSFEGVGLVQRHQMIYKAVEPVKDAIHAIAMKTVTSKEWNK